MHCQSGSARRASKHKDNEKKTCLKGNRNLNNRSLTNVQPLQRFRVETFGQTVELLFDEHRCEQKSRQFLMSLVYSVNFTQFLNGKREIRPTFRREKPLRVISMLNCAWMARIWHRGNLPDCIRWLAFPPFVISIISDDSFKWSHQRFFGKDSLGPSLKNLHWRLIFTAKISAKVLSSRASLGCVFYQPHGGYLF